MENYCHDPWRGKDSLNKSVEKEKIQEVGGKVIIAW